jgi:hypothetical protein
MKGLFFMSIEQMIIKIEQVCSILDALCDADANYIGAMELSHETLFDVAQNLKPLVKGVELA